MFLYILSIFDLFHPTNFLCYKKTSKFYTHLLTISALIDIILNFIFREESVGKWVSPLYDYHTFMSPSNFTCKAF